MTSIALYDYDCTLDRKLLRDLAEAATIWTTRDFGQPAPRGWGLSATIRVIESKSDLQPDEWLLGLFSHPTVAGALGWHDALPSGRPRLVVYPTLVEPHEIGIVITHEIGEALADPEISRTAVGTDGVIRSLEPCDAVETDSYKIQVRSGVQIAVSNFVTPLYFEPPTQLDGARFDFMGTVQAPYELRPGGYESVYQAGTWIQNVNGALGAYRQAVAHVSRSAQRQRLDDIRPQK